MSGKQPHDALLLEDEKPREPQFSIPFVSDVIDETGGFVGDAFQYVVDNPQVIIAVGVGIVTGFAGSAVLGPAFGLGSAEAGALGGAIGEFTTGLIASGSSPDANDPV